MSLYDGKNSNNKKDQKIKKNREKWENEKEKKVEKDKIKDK